LQNNMAALNIFKKGKSEVKPKAKNEKAPKTEGIKTEDTELQTPLAQSVLVPAGDSQLVRPHITEKATDLAANNMYVFVVRPGASKKEIGRSVEKAYGVKVKRVRVINVHPKNMRLGRSKGVKQGYKKAMVQIQEGQRIEILPT